MINAWCFKEQLRLLGALVLKQVIKKSNLNLWQNQKRKKYISKNFRLFPFVSLFLGKLIEIFFKTCSAEIIKLR